MINKEGFYTLYKQIFGANNLSEFCDDATIEKMFLMISKNYKNDAKKLYFIGRF